MGMRYKGDVERMLEDIENVRDLLVRKLDGGSITPTEVKKELGKIKTILDQARERVSIETQSIAV